MKTTFLILTFLFCMASYADTTLEVSDVEKIRTVLSKHPKVLNEMLTYGVTEGLGTLPVVNYIVLEFKNFSNHPEFQDCELSVNVRAQHSSATRTARLIFTEKKEYSTSCEFVVNAYK